MGWLRSKCHTLCVLYWIFVELLISHSSRSGTADCDLILLDLFTSVLRCILFRVHFHLRYNVTALYPGKKSFIECDPSDSYFDGVREFSHHLKTYSKNKALEFPRAIRCFVVVRVRACDFPWTRASSPCCSFVFSVLSGPRRREERLRVCYTIAGYFVNKRHSTQRPSC